LRQFSEFGSKYFFLANEVDQGYIMVERQPSLDKAWTSLALKS
jgi:hypothetical protein